MVNCVIISKSFMIREVYELLIRNNVDYSSCNKIMSIEEASDKKIDLLVVDCSTHNKDELIDIFNYKDKNNNVKVILVSPSIDIDRYICLKGKKFNIEGFIVDHYNNDELAWIIRSIINGHKFYDAKIVDKLIDTINHNKTEDKLTKREKEITYYINKGLDNLNISTMLNISENTVKKHIGSILKKLDLRNRKEIIVYSNRKNFRFEEINCELKE